MRDRNEGILESRRLEMKQAIEPIITPSLEKPWSYHTFTRASYENPQQERERCMWDHWGLEIEKIGVANEGL